MAQTCLSQMESLSVRACFSKAIRNILPNINIYHLWGNMSWSMIIGTMRSIEGMDQSHGGGFIKFKMVEGANHVVSYLKIFGTYDFSPLITYAVFT
jgi:hypothetical protein